MKIFIACSKHFYDKIPEIIEQISHQGHQINLPNSYNDPFKEEEIKKLGLEAHIEWKADMMRKNKQNIRYNDAILVLNFEKNGQQNYIGGATFIEMYQAWELEKRLFLYYPIPHNIMRDELIVMNPIVLNGDLTKVK